MDITVVSHNEEETIESGISLAQKLSPRDVVFLRGDLGSGKTTFAKGIAKGLGISTRIISPTFVIVREHEVDSGKIKKMYHLDLYRLHDEREALGVDIKDILNDDDGVVVIEWPEISQNLVKKQVWNVRIDNINEDERRIKIAYE